jgi:D-arginine dehydrogenase
METSDFLIVGAGIAGVSLAAELSPHARVTLAEREEVPGYHATGRSAALYTEAYGNAAIRSLTSASRTFYDNPPPALFEHALLRRRGCLYLAAPERMDTLDAFAADVGSRGLELTALDAAALRERVPLLRPQAAGRGLLEVTAADIDVDLLLQGFLRAARKAGARIALSHAVTTISRVSGGWQVGFANGDTIMAAKLVNAAGAWADQTARLAGLAPIGIQPCRRTAVLLDPPPGVDIRDWPAVIDADEQWYFKPDAGRILGSPADETPSEPCDAQPDEMDVAICIDRLQSVLDLPVRRVARAWAGLRSFAPDRTPVVGYDPANPNFFWLAGQGGYGVQTAPALSRTAAALALGNALPSDIEGFGVQAADLSPARLRAHKRV